MSQALSSTMNCESYCGFLGANLILCKCVEPNTDCGLHTELQQQLMHSNEQIMP